MTAAIDFNAGGYRFKDLVRAGIVSSRGNLNYLQRRLGFPRPIKTGLSWLGFQKAKFMNGSPRELRCAIALQTPKPKSVRRARDHAACGEGLAAIPPSKDDGRHHRVSKSVGAGRKEE